MFGRAFGRNKDRSDERREDQGPRLDQPQEKQVRVLPRPSVSAEDFGVLSERFARFMGTATFLIWMTIFVAVWLVWNTFLPTSMQFDPRSLNYTLLTLILSLQASYAAPLILLAQNRQDDRDRVGLEQDRSRDERNLADTEFLTREVASLRLAMRETATRDFVRSELRSLLEEMEERGMIAIKDESLRENKKSGKKKNKGADRPDAGAKATPQVSSASAESTTDATSGNAPKSASANTSGATAVGAPVASDTEIPRG